MVAPIYANKKGIYKNLYKEIDSDNKKKKAEEVSSKRSPKGIYKDLYEQINSFTGQENKQKETWDINLLKFISKRINFIFSKASCFFSTTKVEIKMLIIACILAKKPVSNYIENNINYLNQGYYNDR